MPLLDVVEDYTTALVGGGGATAIDLDVPSTAKEHDPLAALVVWRGQTTVTAAETWDDERHDQAQANGPTLALYTRIRQAGDPDSYTFTNGGVASRVVGALLRLNRGAAWHTSGVQAGNSTTPTAPSVDSPGLDHALIAAWAWSHPEEDDGLPEGLDEIVEVNSLGAAGGQVRVVIGAGMVAAGATGAQALTLTPANARGWVGVAALIDMIGAGGRVHGDGTGDSAMWDVLRQLGW